MSVLKGKCMTESKPELYEIHANRQSSCDIIFHIVAKACSYHSGIATDTFLIWTNWRISMSSSLSLTSGCTVWTTCRTTGTMISLHDNERDSLYRSCCNKAIIWLWLAELHTKRENRNQCIFLLNPICILPVHARWAIIFKQLTFISRFMWVNLRRNLKSFKGLSNIYQCNSIQSYY